MKKRIYFFLVLITFLLTFCIRFYRLDSVPSGLNQDETALGYNAYTILTTGKDEYGNHLPLYFKSFGDYKLPVYVYLTAASIKAFGLTTFAVRFPSAFLGSVSVMLLFFLLTMLTQKRALPLISSMLLAINPWHVFLSRAAFEVNVAVFFLLMGTYLFVLAIKQRNNISIFSFSILCFVIALYTYNVTRLFAPMLFVSLIGIYFQQIKKMQWARILVLLVLFLVGTIPFIVTLFHSSGLISQKSVLIIGGDTQANMIEWRSYLAVLPQWFVKVLFNTTFLVTWRYVQNIAGFFSIPFLFLSGADNGSVSVGNVGLFYLFELPCMLAGIFLGIKNKIVYLSPFLAWLGITVLLTALSKDVPHGTRSYIGVIPLTIFSAYGLLFFIKMIQTLKKRSIRNLLYGIASSIMVYAVIYFFLSYFIRFPIVYAKTWRASDQALALYLQKEAPHYTQVIIDTDSDFIYTSLLFYQQYPPRIYLSSNKHTPDSLFITLSQVGKYTFRHIDFAKDMLLPHTLLVTGGQNMLPSDHIVKIFTYPTRPVVLYVSGNYAQYPVTDIAYKVFATK